METPSTAYPLLFLSWSDFNLIQNQVFIIECTGPLNERCWKCKVDGWIMM